MKSEKEKTGYRSEENALSFSPNFNVDYLIFS